VVVEGIQKVKPGASVKVVHFDAAKGGQSKTTAPSAENSN
jgi:hypothetical protein